MSNTTFRKVVFEKPEDLFDVMSASVSRGVDRGFSCDYEGYVYDPFIGVDSKYSDIEYVIRRSSRVRRRIV